MVTRAMDAVTLARSLVLLLHSDADREADELRISQNVACSLSVLKKRPRSFMAACYMQSAIAAVGKVMHLGAKEAFVVGKEGRKERGREAERREDSREEEKVQGARQKMK